MLKKSRVQKGFLENTNNLTEKLKQITM